MVGIGVSRRRTTELMDWQNRTWLYTGGTSKEEEVSVISMGFNPRIFITGRYLKDKTRSLGVQSDSWTNFITM